MNNPLRVGKTPYDDFLVVLLTMIGGLNSVQRATMALLWDAWQTPAAYTILNAVYSKDRFSPDDGAHERPYSPPLATEAAEIIAWKTARGPRPAWLASITDQELDALQRL